jgi:hypothetical protein
MLDIIRAAIGVTLFLIGFLGVVLLFGPILLILFAIPILFLIALF